MGSGVQRQPLPQGALDRALVRERFDRSAHQFERCAVLQQEVGRRLLERLALIKLSPQRILDLGCATGGALAPLQKRYPEAQLVAVDLSPQRARIARRRGGIWRRFAAACADLEQLPLPAESCDLVLSNLALPWCHDIAAALAEWRRVVRPGGALLFATLGPDTLSELRQSWAEVDEAARVHLFFDMHDLGDLLLRHGWGEPVVDNERITLTYRALPDLWRDLKATGSTNALQERPRGLLGRGRYQRLVQAYGARRCADQFPVSCEIVYGFAWAAAPRSTPTATPGVATFPIQKLRRQRR